MPTHSTVTKMINALFTTEYGDICFKARMCYFLFDYILVNRSLVSSSWSDMDTKLSVSAGLGGKEAENIQTHSLSASRVEPLKSMHSTIFIFYFIK